MLGKVIDVEFRVGDRGRWCVRCDEPFPEGTAMCPRCGGELASAARHRAEVVARARKQARRWVATGLGLVLFVLAAIAWLLFGPGVAHADEKTAPPSSASSSPGTSTATNPPAATTTPPATTKKTKKDKVAVVVPPKPSEPIDPNAESTMSPRPVRVRLLDGSTVVGTVHAEEAGMLVVDCSLGQLSIPRARISTIAYDTAAGVGQKRAPVQQLDDEDKPTKKRTSSSQP